MVIFLRGKAEISSQEEKSALGLPFYALYFNDMAYALLI